MPKSVKEAYVKFVDSIHNNIRTGNKFNVSAFEQYRMQNSALSFRIRKVALVSALEENDVRKAEDALKGLYLQVDLAAQQSVQDLSEEAFEIIFSRAVEFVAIATEAVFKNFKAKEVKEEIIKSLLGSVIDYSRTTRDILLHLFFNFKKINEGEKDLYERLGDRETPTESLKKLYITSVEYEASRIAPSQKPNETVGLAPSIIFSSPYVAEAEVPTTRHVAKDSEPTTPFDAKDVDKYAYSLESTNRRMIGNVNLYAADVVANIESQVTNLSDIEKKYIKQISHMFAKWENNEQDIVPTYSRVYDSGIQHSIYFGAAVISMIVNSNLTEEEKALLLFHTCSYDNSESEYDVLTLSVLKQCVLIAGCTLRNSFPIYTETLKKRVQEISNEQIRDSIRNSFEWAFYTNLGGKLC